MIRLAGALLVFFSGAVLAYFLNGKARAALTQVEGFMELVRRLRTEIDCFSMPIPLALAGCPDEVFKKCGFDDSRECIRTLDDLLGGCEIFLPEAAELMEGFAARLGRGYKHEQLALCDGTLARLEDIRLSLASELPAKQKINGTLCLCGALAVVILTV
mgnify:CR=1 FL=1